MDPYRYWKEEEKERKWKKISDTPQALAEIIGMGAMFRTWTVFQNNGQPEPHRWGDFPLDFDCADNPATFIYTIAHEMAHIVLHSLSHPEKRNEVYTDITAMMLASGTSSSLTANV